MDREQEQGEKKTYLEVKGVTLEENGDALFPDAPTERGARHLKELMEKSLFCTKIKRRTLG